MRRCTAVSYVSGTHDCFGLFLFVQSGQPFELWRLIEDSLRQRTTDPQKSLSVIVLCLHSFFAGSNVVKAILAGRPKRTEAHEDTQSDGASFFSLKDGYCERPRGKQNTMEEGDATGPSRGSGENARVNRREAAGGIGQQQGKCRRQSSYVIGGPPECQHPGCTQRARYKHRGPSGAFPQVCNDHKSPGMVRTCAALCEVRGCTTTANFNFPGQKRRLRCGTHREDGMLHVSSICEVVGCLTTAGFQRSPGQKPTRCSAHREEGMMIFGKLCRQPGCKTIAHYGYAGSRKSFCKHHSKEGMIREPLVNPALRWRR